LTVPAYVVSTTPDALRASTEMAGEITDAATVAEGCVANARSVAGSWTRKSSVVRPAAANGTHSLACVAWSTARICQW
jgi:hypothetical protein